MAEYVLWVLLLSIWNIVLFFGKEYGISVILFMVPLMIYLYYILKKNNKIVNKKGLLFIIPILLLSITYLVYNNYNFNVLNLFVIPILICLMYIYTTNPTYNVKAIIRRLIKFVFYPYKYIARFYRVATTNISDRFKVSTKFKKILITILIVIPVSIIIIGLLSSADQVFSAIFDDFFNKLFEILRFEFFDHLLGRIFSIIFMAFIIGCTTMYLIFEEKDKDEVVKVRKDKDLYIIKTLLTVLNVIYIVFDYIQIRSLLFHKVASNIDYAVYARRGFFELLVVSFINLFFILLSRRMETKKNKKEYNYVKVMNVIMVLLTIIIIASSFMRMHMYEAQFGYTTLRLLVYAVLICESLLMIPTVMYIFNEKFNIVKSYMIIIICSYLVINVINMDYVIARRNVNRYYLIKDIDLDYLETYTTDNIPVLTELYTKTEETEVRNELYNYLYDMTYMFKDRKQSIFEFNISKRKAKKELDKIEFKESDYKGYLDYE